MKAAASDKTSIIWLSLAHLTCDIYGGFINPIMPFIASKLGFTMALATVLVAVTQICSNMLQPLFGFFADNTLKRFFIFWGLILASTFIPLAPSAPNVFCLTLFMILGCLGGSFFHPQSLGFVSIFSGKNYSDNMGLFVSLGSFGFALGPLLAAFITQIAGLENVIYSSAIGLVLAPLMFVMVPKLSSLGTKPAHKDFFKSFKEIILNTQMRYIMIIAMMKSLITNSYCILLPFLWKSMNCSPFYIGFAIFLFVFAGSIGSFLSPKIEKKLGSKTIIYFSMLATFPLTIIFALTYQSMPALSLVVFALSGFSTTLAQPVFLVLAQKAMPEYKSIVSGFVNGFCWGLVALCISFMGACAQKFGIINVLIFLSLIPVVSSRFVRYIRIPEDM